MFAHPLEVNIGPSPFLRVQVLLGHYDLRLYQGEAYIDVGRGSIGAFSRLAHIPLAAKGCVGVVGQWCDFAEDCKLYGGVEHHNDSPVNVVFGCVPAFRSTAYKEGMAALLAKHGAPFAIGNAAVISADCKVMAGAKIGDGAVLAAGAVAAGELEPFAIHGGVPAKKIRDRKIDRAVLEKVRWWDFDTAYIGDNLARLQELAVDTQAKHAYRKPTPRMVLRVGTEVEFLGVVDGELTDKARAYVKSMTGPDPHTWVANIWD